MFYFLAEESHSIRVSRLCLLIGEAMGLSEAELSKLQLTGLLHDIGKIEINTGILNKPGALTTEEWEQVRKHPYIGYRILSANPQTAALAEAVLAHHERWDGKGYPRGLRELEIPLSARILTLADSFDAMVSSRTYRQALTLEEAEEEVLFHAAKQFDPQIVHIFLQRVLSKKALLDKVFR